MCVILSSTYTTYLHVSKQTDFTVNYIPKKKFNKQTNFRNYTLEDNRFGSSNQLEFFLGQTLRNSTFAETFKWLKVSRCLWKEFSPTVLWGVVVAAPRGSARLVSTKLWLVAKCFLNSVIDELLYWISLVIVFFFLIKAVLQNRLYRLSKYFVL